MVMTIYEKIKNVIKKNEKLYQYLRELNQYLRELKWGEKKRRYGKAATQYFVLRRPSYGNGIASDILVFLGQLKYMEEKYTGYQPVIDMQNYPQGISETTGDSGNAWEDFFLQPNEGHDGLQAVMESKSVILASVMSITRNEYEIPTQTEYRELVKKNWDYYFKKYIHLREDLTDRFLRDWDRLIENKAKIVGVKARGTDYASVKPGGAFSPAYRRADCRESRRFSEETFRL